MLSEHEQTAIDTWVAQNGTPARHGPPSFEDMTRSSVSNHKPTMEFRPTTHGARRKISDDTVRAIRADPRSAREVAAAYSVGISTVHQIRQCRLRQDAGGCAGRAAA